MASALDYLRQLLGGGDPDQQRWAETQAQQPGVLQHFQNVLSDVPARFGGTNSYDPNRSLAQNTLDPESLQQAMTVGTQVSPGAIRAYHGSPHNFDAFDINKIGTGEGAQAYGRGLYFAESEPVARSYRDALSSKGVKIGDDFRSVDPSAIDDVALAHLEAFANLPNKYELARKSIKDRADISGVAQQRSLQRALDVLNNWEKAGAVPASSGHMYEVNLHADPEAFLQYERRLHEQSPQVRGVLNSLPFLHEGAGTYSPFTGGEIKPGGPAMAKEMADAGIPGIRYLDQGSRGAGEGSHNYAVFDPKIIEIMRKYGIVPPIAGTGLLADQQ